MIDQLRKQLGPTVLEQESLAAHVTFQLGGPAKYFYPAHSADELYRALVAAEQLVIPYLVLGIGSNVIIADTGFDGLVIQVQGGTITVDGTSVVAEAGAPLGDLVVACTNAGLAGVERLAGIPSTVGGAVRGNAGAYGQSIGDVVAEVTIFANGKKETLDRAAMQFGYRDSILKHQSGVLLSARLQLAAGDSTALKTINEETIEKRRRFPTEPSAGCIFKNIELDKVAVDVERVKRVLELTDEEWREVTKFGKLPTGFILQRMQYGGQKRGGVQMSDKHCAYMIKVGDARAEHAIMFISEMKMRVRNELGIQLQEEVQYVGF
jgi:UDP-N-acetylmuramate dehydrogenase